MAVDAVRGVPAGVPLESLPRLPPAGMPRVDWPPDERRRVVALRLVAPQPERFAGRSLRQALAAEGFVLGRFAIFHKPDDEQRAVLSAASLTRPGTFDVETMDSQHYGGLSLFAVLPGPKPPAAGLRRSSSSPRATSTSACAGSCRTSRGAVDSRAHRAAARAPECRGGFVTDKPAARAAELRAQITQHDYRYYVLE